jgi:hypothetical protein
MSEEKNPPIRFYQAANYGGLCYYPIGDEAKALLAEGRKTIEFGAIFRAIKDGKRVQMRCHDSKGNPQFIDWTFSN